MKLLRFGLFVSILCLVVGWGFLAFSVPLWADALPNQKTQMPTYMAVLFTLSNHARTPLGIFLTMCLSGFIMVLLILAFKSKKI